MREGDILFLSCRYFLFVVFLSNCTLEERNEALLLCGWSCLHLSSELYLRTSALFSNHSPGQQKDLHADGAEQRRQKTLDE